MGSSPSSCKICCYQKPKIVNSLHVQIYDNVNNELYLKPLIALQSKISIISIGA